MGDFGDYITIRILACVLAYAIALDSRDHNDYDYDKHKLFNVNNNYSQPVFSGDKPSSTRLLEKLFVETVY